MEDANPDIRANMIAAITRLQKYNFTLLKTIILNALHQFFSKYVFYYR